MAPRNEKLEAARLQRRWSVEVASAKAGVSVNTFNRWERGLQVPQLDTLDRLCNAFNMTPEELGFGDAIASKRRTQVILPEQRASIAAEPPHTYRDTPGRNFSQQTLFAGIDVLSDLAWRHERDQAHGEQDNQALEFSRREAITLLVSTPSAVFELAQEYDKSLLHPQEIIALCEINVPLCWQLYFEGGFTEVEQVLPGYIAQLTAIAQQPSIYQKKGASLVSQVHQLSYLLAIQRQDFGTALSHTGRAATYSQLAADRELRVTALMRQAYVYFCLGRTSLRMQAYQEALQYSPGSSALIRGYLYAGLAETHAARRETQEAKRYLDLAYQTFPAQPEDDPAFSFTRFRWPTLYTFDGQIQLYLNQLDHAWEAFMKVDQSVPQGLVPLRAEVTVYQAATTLAMNELEQCCALLELAATSTLALGSRLRYDQAAMVYENALEKWGREPGLKRLTPLFQ
jgi:transcriptional regulator with XRE-family HTH domain